MRPAAPDRMPRPRLSGAAGDATIAGLAYQGMPLRQTLVGAVRTRAYCARVRTGRGVRWGRRPTATAAPSLGVTLSAVNAAAAPSFTETAR